MGVLLWMGALVSRDSVFRSGGVDTDGVFFIPVTVDEFDTLEVVEETEEVVEDCEAGRFSFIWTSLPLVGTGALFTGRGGFPFTFSIKNE